MQKIPNDLPDTCEFRVWIGSKSVCVYDDGIAVHVTSNRITYAPTCSSNICPLKEIWKG